MYATAKEWTLSLLSKKHAETSWLRISEQDERRALLICQLALIGLLIALAFVIRLDIHRWQQRQWILSHPIERTIDPKYLNEQII